MKEFDLNTNETLTQSSISILTQLKEDVGFIPNIYTLASGSDVAFDAFFQLNSSFSQSQFTPIEREVIQLVVSVENNCNYCVAGHSLFADNLGVSKKVLEALRNGEPVEDPRLQGLSQFTRSLILSKGKPDEFEVSDFFDLGFEKSHVIELILGIALKTFTNILSRLSKLPLDEPFLRYDWSSSSIETSQNNQDPIKVESHLSLNL